MSLKTSSFFLSKFLRYVSRSSRSLSTTSSRFPVASFLYLAIKGMVFPSSIKSTVLLTCETFTPSSFANCFIILSILHTPKLSFIFFTEKSASLKWSHLLFYHIKRSLCKASFHGKGDSPLFHKEIHKKTPLKV